MRTTNLTLILAWYGIAAMAAETPQPITMGGTSASAAGNSLLDSMTPDGRYVVFTSRAGNLVANDDQHWRADIVLHDVESGQTALVSVNMRGIGAGDGDSSYASVSDDGRYVVFASDARNLVANDTNDVSDVFRRDLQSGTTELVSVALSGGVAAPSRGRKFLGASRPIMTSDGRYVAFESASTNLVTGDTNQTEKIFLRDMQNGTTVLASGDQQACLSASLSSNATQIAFVAGRGSQYVFVRDLRTGETLITAGPVFSGIFSRSFEPVLAADGRFVVFKAVGAAGTPVHVFQYDLATRQASVLATNSHPSTAPTLSADGRWLACEENGRVYLRDVENGTNVLVSANAAGGVPLRGTSHTPVVSGNGQHVAFVSSVTNLVASLSIADTNASHIYVRDVVSGTTRLITRTTNGLPAAISGATQPLINDDGSRVVFDSDVATLTLGDNNDAYDVFMSDLDTSAVRLLSTEHSQRRAVTGIRSATLTANSISDDGTRIAFAMLDNGRIAADTNRNYDVFVHDRISGALIPQSSSNGVFLTTRRVSNPFISAGGEHIIFELWGPKSLYSAGGSRFLWKRVNSEAMKQITNTLDSLDGPVHAEWVVALNSNGTLVAIGDHLHDMLADTNRLLIPFMRRAIRQPIFSPDDTWIVGKTNVGLAAMYAVHLQTTNTVLISKNASGQQVGAYGGAFSGSGRYFVFDTLSAIYRYDFHADSVQLVSTNGSEPAIDSSGNLIAFSSAVRGRPAPGQLYVQDVTAARTDLISRNAFGTGTANGHSRAPLISGDGRYVVFVSSASDLIVGDNNNADDIFVHDRVQRSTVVLTRTRQATGSANALSSMPVLARDGRTVVFQSFASDLIDGDYNEERDIFVTKLGMGDSDSDGMDDDWEVAHFGNLSRDGAGDQDNDGQTDLQEFLAGTDPTNGGSILRVLTVTPMSGGSTTVVWSAVVGRRYVVQFKDSLEADWINASGVIEADSNSMSFTHNSSAPQRFYRVIAMQ